MDAVLDDALALNATFGRRGAIEFATSELGGVIARLASSAGHALVSLKGGQVLSWVPAGQPDVLWLSALARLDTPKAIRGGVPICWPWFGPHPQEPSYGAHGYARTSQWCCVGSDAGADGVSLTLEFDTGPGSTLPVNRAARAILTVTLTSTLRIELTTIPDPYAPPLTISEALHTYLRVGDISRISVEGLEGARYLDSVASGAESHQRGPITFDREVDRIYVDTGATVRINDPVLNRRITIAKEGSASTVVWNPWIEKAERLGDLGRDGFREFVCVETANAGPNELELAPGTSHRLTALISVEP